METVCYAMTVTGVEPIAAEEIEQRLNAEIKRTAPGLVVFRPPQIDRTVLKLLTAEDVFLLGWGTDKLTHRALDLEHMRKWTSKDVDWDELLRIHHTVRPKPKGKPTYRLVVQMDGQHVYHRKSVIEVFAKGLAGKFPASWRPAEENASVEFWLTIDGSTAVCGLRLSDRNMRHRHYKIEHVPASLRPALAAAMVRLADIQTGQVILDPMCGAGTLLAETLIYGRMQYRNCNLTLVGGDSDPSAVRATNVNLRQLISPDDDDGPRKTDCELTEWDAAQLPLEDGSVDRIVCNLPFGKQIGDPREIGPLYDTVLPEMDRVLRSGGRAVLLTSHVAAAKGAMRAVKWKQGRYVPVRILGQKATILVGNKP